MSINKRLDTLRKAMHSQSIDAYLIPSSDPHQSEYVASHWKAREWISGFTGSAGLAIITKDQAGIWTDSRYYIQAEEELQETAFHIHPLYKNGKIQYPDWLQKNLAENDTLGLDAFLWTPSQIKRIKRAIDPKRINLKTDVDLISLCWKDRPGLPKDKIFELNLHYAGESRVAKIRKIRAQLSKNNAQYYLISKLDDIAWLLNLRGRDIAFNPVFLAYLWLGLEECTLFIDPHRVPEDLQTSLLSEGIDLRFYQEIEGYLKKLPAEHSSVYIDSTLNAALRKRLNPEHCIEGKALIQHEKAVKNATEINHMREVMIKDGIALVRFYRWLEEFIPSGYLTESDCAIQLQQFRSQQNKYFGESFPPIVGYRANGAIVHYRPDAKTSAILKPKGLLLIDSGGQYLDGTTDITRTISLGAASLEEKAAFTNVLKGHIALASIHFPEGTTGGQLDVLARMYLWKNGQNYGHGTGHGIGFFLNVHEGPLSISPMAATPRGRTPFKAGMITSNEPGFYKTGAFGIRTENLILCQESEYSTPHSPFFKFETLSLFPIDHTLIDFSLLEVQEINWLNNYHQEVYQKLHPYLNEAEGQWLAQKCQVIEWE